LLAATASVVEFQLTPASGSGKQAWHIPDAVCTVNNNNNNNNNNNIYSTAIGLEPEFLMMGGETA